MNRYHLFDTAAGVAAIGWNECGVSLFRLPAPSAQETERAVARHLPDARRSPPSNAVADVIAATIRYFAGERIEFTDCVVDLGTQEPFFARVYDHIRKLGWGETTTYGAVAKACGAVPEAARAVGQAMARNPMSLIVPCHRVLAAGNKVGGFSAPGGSVSKERMLALEGVSLGSTNATAQSAFAFF